jgi:hypothetical protein
MCLSQIAKQTLRFRISKARLEIKNNLEGQLTAGEQGDGVIRIFLGERHAESSRCFCLQKIVKEDFQTLIAFE